MLKVTPEQATTALNEFINLGEELKPMVTETDLVERFLLTLHQYHRGEPVNISIWLNGLKSDGESVKATAFQSVKIVDNNHNTVGYVHPLLVDPTGTLPPEITSMLHDLFYKADNLEKVIPGRGKQFIKENVVDRVKNRDKDIEALRKLWDRLFVKYGLEPVYSDPNTVIETTEALTSPSLDDDEFDAEYL